MSGGVVCCWTHSVSEAESESENISECDRHPLTSK